MLRYLEVSIRLRWQRAWFRCNLMPPSVSTKRALMNTIYLQAKTDLHPAYRLKCFTLIGKGAKKVENYGI